MSNMPVRNINRLSRLYQPVTSTVSNPNKLNTSKSYENLIKYGLINPLNKGMYALLPLALRVLNKLISLVDNEMEKIGAQKMLLPSLTATSLWEQTNRFECNKSELFKVQDRYNGQYILSPTHEEAICKLLSAGILSPKILPLKLYQISSKWRDEMKPRLGLLRSREFVMKDLYTFDKTLENAQESYESVCDAYNNIFKKIGVTYIKAAGDTGSIGGLVSHEYHYESNIGDDIILTCSSCHYSINKTVCKDSHCSQCKSTFHEQQTAEVGHAFLLDTKYTKPLNALYKINHVTAPLAMGCFGLGLSRIFTVMTEVLSTSEELRWPQNFAPYTVCIIPPKTGSKEEPSSQYMDQIIDILDELNIDCVLDDRTNLTIGKRFIHSRVTGFPYIIVIGKSAMKSPPFVEIHNIYSSEHHEVPLENIRDYFIDKNITN